MFRSKLGLSFSLLIIIPSLTTVESKCSNGCDLALGSYYVWPGANLGLITRVSTNSINDILSYNTNITNDNYEVTAGTRINISFTCDCIDGESLGHVFPYQVNSGDTYHQIVQTYYANLTTVAMLEQFNGAVLPDMILEYEVLKVPVNCSCGDASVSEAYGLFITYPLRIEDSLESIAAAANLSKDLLQRYNPGANFSAGSGLVYIPGRDKSGHYPPLNTRIIRWGHSWNICRNCIGALLVVVAVSIFFYKKKKVKDKTRYEDLLPQAGINVDKSVEFSREELAKATNDFSIDQKIGQGGFGSVYYTEL